MNESDALAASSDGTSNASTTTVREEQWDDELADVIRQRHQAMNAQEAANTVDDRPIGWR
ncbi:MAG: hypothetical protein R3B96_22610 [Pirellulaceae bacterium]